jgi:hypothetical protein
MLQKIIKNVTYISTGSDTPFDFQSDFIQQLELYDEGSARSNKDVLITFFVTVYTYQTWSKHQIFPD